MRLYFLRHAEALDGLDDAARPLSPRGHEQAREMGRFLKKAGVQFDAAFSSPLVRARETAERVLEVCGRVKPGQLVLVEALLNGTRALDFQGWLRGLPEVNHVLLVGHNPSLTEHVRRLLSVGDDEALDLPKGGLAVIRLLDGGSGVLKLYLSPKSLGGS
jgi:phosphohistidine phosphatase